MGLALPSLAVSAASALALALLLSCRAASREPPPSNRSDDAASDDPARLTGDALGLGGGATWQFRGQRTWFDVDRNQEIVEPMTWTTRVVAEKAEPTRVVYRVIGWPGLAPHEPTRETSLTVLDDGTVYFGDAPRPAKSDAWIRLPLRHGNSLCDGDLGYCWSVEAAGTGFDVVLRTRPDMTLYHLEPGRGVTRYEYHHNGSTDDVVLERVD